MTDFALGIDHLVLGGFGLHTAEEALALGRQAGGAAVFTMADGSEIRLRGVDLAAMTATDFILT